MPSLQIVSGPSRLIASLALAGLIVGACELGVAAPTPSPSGQSHPTAPASPAVDPDGLPVLGDVPVYKGDAARTGQQAGPGPVAAPVEVWRLPLGCSTTDHIPVVANGILVIGCDGPTVVAVDARIGRERWRASLKGALHGAAGIADGVVFAADDGGMLSAFDLESGDVRWSREVHPFRHPGVVNGTLYVGTTDGKVLGLDPATGDGRWSWQAPQGVSNVIATVVDGTLYAGADDGHLYAVSVGDGSIAWSFRALSGRVSTPSVTADTVFVSALQNEDGQSGGLYALDRATGAERWRVESPSGDQIAPPTVADGTVYAPSRSDGLFAFDAASGDRRWVNDSFEHIGGQAPAISPTAVYLAADRTLGAYDRADGHELWSVDLPADTEGGPMISGGMAFIGDNAGDLLAFAEPALAAQIEPAPAAPESASPMSTTSAAALAFEPRSDWTKDAIGTARSNGMDIGPDGLLYVVAADTSEIVVIDPTTGTVVRRWGGPGSDVGQFDFLRQNGDDLGGVAVAADGTVYVADSQNRRIQAFDAEGKPLRQWGRFGEEDGQFSEPLDVAIGPDGDVFVVDDQRDDIQRFSPDGEYKQTIGEHGSGDGHLNYTGGIDVGPDGTLYNADWTNRRVQAWDATGKWLWTLDDADGSPFEEPADIAVDAAGRIFVFDHGNKTLHAFDGDRQHLASVPVKDGYMLTEQDGTVYVGGASIRSFGFPQP